MIHSLETAKRLGNLLPHANINVLPGTGHVIINIADKINKFLNLQSISQSAPFAFTIPNEQQRVSITRAIVKNPKLLLCDEPTGALDFLTARSILKLLQQVNKEHGTTILMITHNAAIAAMVTIYLIALTNLTLLPYINFISQTYW